MRRLLCRMQFIFDALLQRDAARGAWKSCYEARLNAPTVQDRSDDLLRAGFVDIQTHRFVFGDAVLIWAKKSDENNSSAPSEA